MSILWVGSHTDVAQGDGFGMIGVGSGGFMLIPLDTLGKGFQI